MGLLRLEGEIVKEDLYFEDEVKRCKQLLRRLDLDASKSRP